MKNNKPHFKALALLILFSCNFLAFAQTQSFPANKTYSYGLIPSNRNGQDAVNNYNTWKTNFIEACSNGRLRVKFDNSSQTVSEGIAYGMLLSAYAADRTTFDGLWNYYKDNRNSNGVMNWKINGCSGIVGMNGATDAELDAAMALIVADYQWKSTGAINYSSDAKVLLTAMKNHEVESGTFVLKPGDMFGGTDLTNPSYFAPGYFRKFASFTGDNFWISVADKCYDVINKNLSVNNAAGGLVSDWCNASGSYSNQAGGYVNGGKKYTYDAARTPWRIALDYVWYGNSAAKTYVKKASDFSRVTIGGTKNIVDGYNQDGSKSGQYHNATFVGAFATAAMGGDNQSHLDDSYSDLNSTNEPTAYFNQTLKTMYLFLLSGNFYLPGNEVVTPPLNVAVTSVSLTPASLSLKTGENGQLTATISPSNATNKSVTYSSSNTSIVTVNSSGLVSAIAAGSTTITVKTVDGNKTDTTAVTVTTNTTPPPTSCAFGAPSNVGLPSFDKVTFNEMHVLGTSTINTSNFRKFQINWNLSGKSLKQFAYSTENGIPNYYIDLRTKVTQNFSATKPSINISGSGITGLDGDYWVISHNNNFVMVSKTNAYTLYFSNSATAPSCSASRIGSEYTNNGILMYPNPTTGLTTVEVTENSFVRVIDFQGRVVLEKESMNAGNLELDLSRFNSGIYNIQVSNNDYTKSDKIILQK